MTASCACDTQSIIKHMFTFTHQALLRLQVRLCRQKTSGKVFAMKKLKKAEMVRRGQVGTLPALAVCAFTG